MPPRRGGGAAAAARKATRQKAMERKGEEIAAQSVKEMTQQLRTFESHLELFAVQHKAHIQKDPAFRAKFHAMCASIGVDPLTSKKGKWADLLGVGDYYFELAVRTIEVCVASRPINGGILSVREVLRALKSRRINYTEAISECVNTHPAFYCFSPYILHITASILMVLRVTFLSHVFRIHRDDVERAVAKLDVLGSGYKIVTAGRERIVQSVPVELSGDHTQVLEACGDVGYTSETSLREKLRWTPARIKTALRFLLDNEIAWLDMQSREPTYWILGLIKGSSEQK